MRQSRVFWWLLRAGQAAVVLEAALGGVLVLMGRKESSLHLIYGLLPLGISFVAEQLRIASAQMVLDRRGFESTADVGQLPESEQRVVVVSILQRELGVMVLAALVILVLLIRAAGTGGLGARAYVVGPPASTPLVAAVGGRSRCCEVLRWRASHKPAPGVGIPSPPPRRLLHRASGTCQCTMSVPYAPSAWSDRIEEAIR